MSSGEANQIILLSLLIFTSLTGLSVASIALWKICWKNAEELKMVDTITMNSTVSCIILHATTVILGTYLHGNIYCFRWMNTMKFRFGWILDECFWKQPRLVSVDMGYCMVHQQSKYLFHLHLSASYYFHAKIQNMPIHHAKSTLF